MNAPTLMAALREALAHRGRVAVLVALDSGPCWVSALKLDERKGAARVHADLAGARVIVPADRVMEVAA